MIIETLETAGFIPAIHAMRNPMNSWEKSDSESIGGNSNRLIIGEADEELSYKLQQAGPEHCKHLRMIFVWADITAPRYWWVEADTYRAGVEKVSCSTMHKLVSRYLDTDDFETDEHFEYGIYQAIDQINSKIKDYREEKDPEKKKWIWRKIIQILPQSYLQKRTVCFSYAALRNIYNQRKGHKLKEWQEFREWVETLPDSWMITD